MYSVVELEPSIVGRTQCGFQTHHARIHSDPTNGSTIDSLCVVAARCHELQSSRAVIIRVLASLEANVTIDADRDLPLSGLGVQRVAMRVETIAIRAAGMAKVTGLVAVILQLRDKLGSHFVLYVT